MELKNIVLPKEQHLAQAGLTNLPNDWSVVEVGELLSSDRGISVGVMYPGKHDPFGVPLLKVGDLTGSVINPNPEFRITPEKHYEYRRTALEGGEILLTLVGGLGQCSIVPPQMAGWNAARAIAVIRLKEPRDAKFVRLCFLSPPLQHLMQVWANTTVQATLNLKEIKQLPLPFPPRAEREAIAHILGTIDDKIELNREMNRTLEAMARAIFKSWFVDFDPVRAKMEGRLPAGMDAATAELFPSDFEESALGMIPKGWAIKRLSEITTKIGSGATPRGGSQVYVEEGISLIRSQNVYDYEFKWEGLARITEETAELLKNVVVEPDDILFNITGDSILRTCVVEPAVLPARVNQHVAIIRAESDIPCRYLHLYLVQQQVKQFLMGFDAGGTRKAVTKGQLESVPVPIPLQPILLRFKEITDALFSKINLNLEQSRTLVSIRDTLLPKLLSGEIRVKEAEKVLEAVT